MQAKERTLMATVRTVKTGKRAVVRPENRHWFLNGLRATRLREAFEIQPTSKPVSRKHWKEITNGY
jgi:hypothetical protein